MDLKALLSHLSPEYSDQIEGRLYLRAKLRSKGKDWATIKQKLEGEGNAEIQDGALSNANLVVGVLSRITTLPGMGNLIRTQLSPQYASILTRPNTPFETIKSSFSIVNGRINSKNLFLAGSDYTVRGNASIGFDQLMKWNATLALSSHFTQELIHHHTNVRYLVGDQDRLRVPFLLEGSPPRFQPAPDVKYLAQVMQENLSRKRSGASFGARKPPRKIGRGRIFKGLEQLLFR
jgi:hypothetical protein